MKKYFSLIILAFFIWSCDSDNEPLPIQNSIRYELFQSSDFEYNGFLEVLELDNGQLQLDIQLFGAEAEEVSFPGHLHFGAYDAPVAEIAAMLKPVDGRTLLSSTLLGPLSDGSVLSFEDFKTFNGHIKIHLAADGPDYEVILVSGNVGLNYSADLGFDMNKITICKPE